MEILLMNNEKAALFDYNDYKQKAKLTKTFDNSEYGKKDSDIFTHKAGRMATSYNHDQSSFSDNGYKDELVHKFSNDVIHYLDDMNREGHVHDLIIISEPSCLGHLRENISKELKDKISEEIPKNFYTERSDTLVKYLTKNVIEA
tara:strand:- start:25935 stop:26369 length:435 start_codon:yes stop_codon:yes gene_type:complete